MTTVPQMVRLVFIHCKLPEKVSCLGASIDVTFVERLLRVLGVKLTRLFA